MCKALCHVIWESQSQKRTRNLLPKDLNILKSLSHVRFFGTPWTVAYQALLSMGFSRQEYWSGLPFLSPGDLPNPGIEPASLASPALVSGLFTASTT